MTRILVGAETSEKLCEAGAKTGNKCIFSAAWENSLKTTSRLKMSPLKFRAKTKGCTSWGLRPRKMWERMFLSEKLNGSSEPEADGGNQLSQVLNSAFWVIVTFVSGSLADQWLTRRQLLPRRPRELGRVCRMLHWSGSELWFPRFLRCPPLHLSGRPPSQHGASTREPPPYLCRHASV